MNLCESSQLYTLNRLSRNSEGYKLKLILIEPNDECTNADIKGQYRNNSQALWKGRMMVEECTRAESSGEPL